MLTNYADPYWNPVKRAFTGFQLAGYECENPFSEPLVRQKYIHCHVRLTETLQ